MNRLILRFVLGYLLGVTIGLIWLNRSDASEGWEIVNLTEVNVNYISFFPGSFDPLITENASMPNRQLGKQLDLNVNMDFMKYGYWDNKVHSLTDDRINPNDSAGQFRLVGLNSRLGLRVSQHLEIGYFHYSQHLLDTGYQAGNGVSNHWPVEDGLEIKLWLFRRDDSKSDTIF